MIILPKGIVKWIEKKKDKLSYYRLILYLASNCNWATGEYKNGLILKKGEIWATRQFLSQVLDIPLRTVKTILNNLAKDKWITISHNYNNNVIIKLNWLDASDLKAKMRPTLASELASDQDDKITQKNQLDIIQDKTECVRECVRPKRPTFNEECVHMNNKKNKEIIEDKNYILLKEKENIKKKKKSAKHKIFNQYEDEYFNKIWELYRSIKNNPKVYIKIGSKKQAYKKYQSLKLSPEKIYDYVHRYIKKCIVTQKYALQVHKLMDELKDEGFREDLDSFNPRMYLALDDVDIHVRDNGVKSKLVFIYQGQELTKEEVLQLLVRKFKSQDFAIQIAQEFRAYLLNEHPNLQGSVKNLFYKFLEERRDYYGYN